MTTTTKIFVVLVCLFSFVFVPLAISFAAQTHNWRKLADEYRGELAIAYANERSVMAIASAEMERYRNLRNRDLQRIADLDNQVRELSRQLAELTAERDELARSREDWTVSARLLTAEMAVKTRHNEELLKAKEEALARERELRVRNLQLNDRVKELDNKLVVMSQQLRQKIDEVTAYRQENEQLRLSSGLGTTAARVMTSTPVPSAQAVSPPAAVPIRGSVTRVEGPLATVDVGSLAGLRPGTRMVVVRNGSEYICDLEITGQIQPTEAVGRILLERDKRVRPGDTVEDAESWERR